MNINVISTRADNKSRRVQTPCPGKSLTEKAHAGQTNINDIVRKYQKTGVLPEPVSNGVYGDFSTATDYHDAQNRLIAAKDQFMALPADVRSLFDNDPGHMFEFVNDPENAEECREIGLLPQLPPNDPSVVKAPVADQEAISPPAPAEAAPVAAAGAE